ncbi:hypothetical protein K443DRAFT_120344 [Laccaria amethystina LaAM-08-1]|uniref:Unplaced genomic scaffold K443scaffold_21, whole genome shotgun sequence n=1 Tax=Laccaria amethystina LaAM-08-1 TaxID=1095629 RepID=A0A0C9YCP2_9AGAR|nr:hypothetical protein K443DRAFT_120344 [Laccaria amethystina LaAM-08-1]
MNNGQKNKTRGKKSLNHRARVHAQGAIATAPHFLDFPAEVSEIVSVENPNISAAFTCLFFKDTALLHSIGVFWYFSKHLGPNCQKLRTDRKRPGALTLGEASWAGKKVESDLWSIPDSVNDDSLEFVQTLGTPERIRNKREKSKIFVCVSFLGDEKGISNLDKLLKGKGKKTVDDEESGGGGSDEDDSETEEPRRKVRNAYASFKEKVNIPASSATTIEFIYSPLKDLSEESRLVTNGEKPSGTKASTIQLKCDLYSSNKAL